MFSNEKAVGRSANFSVNIPFRELEKRSGRKSQKDSVTIARSYNYLRMAK